MRPLKFVVAILVVLLFATGPAAGAVAGAADGARSFVSHGPFGGAITALAVDPSDGAIAYAATGIRVFKTSDGGRHWTKVFERDDPFGSVNAIAVVPKQPETVYLGAEFNSLPTETQRGHDALDHVQRISPQDYRTREDAIASLTR